MSGDLVEEQELFRLLTVLPLGAGILAVAFVSVVLGGGYEQRSSLNGSSILVVVVVVSGKTIFCYM